MTFVTLHGVPMMTMLVVAMFSMMMVSMMLPSPVSAGSVYSLTTPPYYTVFSGDLDINYTIPGSVSLPHAFVRLEFQKKGTTMTITTMGLRLGYNTGNLRVTCGVIEFAGNYTLKMFTHVNGKVLTQTSLDVRWPEVGLSLPDSHDAQTSSVELRIISRANCSSLLHQYFLQIELYFQRNIHKGNSLELSSADRLFVTNSTAVNKTYSTMDFGCHLFDLDGYYQVVLKSSAEFSPIVATSNVMAVKWSYGYHLSVMVQSAFPCHEDITLIYTHPPCSGSADKIRLYSYNRISEGSLAAPLEKFYVMETVADPDLTEMTFNCKLFNQSATGFCFEYVSVTRGDVVSEQRKLCLPAQADSVFPIDGGWSKWTAWTSCSVTCGTGKKSRFRICNEPLPKHGGRFCDGDPVEWMPCDMHCPEAIPKTPLQSPEIDPNCACGCVKTDVEGTIIATGRCHGLSTWTVKAEDSHVVSLHFDYFSLNYTRQWIKIRDGTSPTDTLLFSSSHRGYPLEIVTSGPAMRVEFMTTYITPPPVAIWPKNATLPIHAHGFIASFEVREMIMKSTAPALFHYEKETLLGSTITIVGIVICAVVIIVAIIFVVVQRTIFKRHVKYTMTNSGESPAHQATGSSAHSSSPSSPGNAIHVDMEVPLTGRSQRKANGGRTSRASSTSSCHSQKVKFLKSKGDSGSAVKGNKSPRLSSKDYASVTSPYGIEIIDLDERGGGDSGSPSRIKSPRSPRVHSSNHRHSPITPVSPATKHEILSKKRHDKQGKGVTADLDRDITGSSGSRSPSTTKAEVNWPQANFVKVALNEVGKSFTDRHKRSAQRPPSEEIPLIDSMTSSQESPLHVSNMVKSESNDSATTSFVTTKARRPTSLTESYSNDTVQKSKPDVPSGNAPAAAPNTFKPASTNRTKPSQENTTKSVQLSSSSIPSSSVNNKPKQPISSASSSSAAAANNAVAASATSKLKYPIKPSSSQNSIGSNKSANRNKKTAYEERQTLLPKPDGQSPKLQRHESPDTSSAAAKKDTEQASPGKTSGSSSKGSKNTFSSPTRSIATSEIEGLELEYDDFIEDDPLSYFDYEETQKLAFRGVEKLGKTPVEEEEEENGV